MSEELWVERVSVERWGRATGMDVMLGTRGGDDDGRGNGGAGGTGAGGDDRLASEGDGRGNGGIEGAGRGAGGGLFVVYGPNESGKTSFAAALAWLIAGAGSQGVLRRFGGPEEKLKAAFQGRIGNEALRADVQVTVTNQAEKFSAARRETFQANLSGESIGRAEFKERLGGVDFHGYRSFYWLEALEVAEGEGLKETLSLKAMFGGINPDEQAAKLEKEAGDLIGRRSNTPDSAWSLMKEDKVLQARISELKDKWQHLAKLEERQKEFVAERYEAKVRRKEVSERAKSVSIAIEALKEGLLERRNEARESLKGAEEPTFEERKLFEDEPRLLGAVAELKVADGELRRHGGEHQAAAARVHPDWRRLVGADPIGMPELDKARRAAAVVAARSEDATEASKSLAVARDELLDCVKRLQTEEDRWHERAPAGLSPVEFELQEGETLDRQSQRYRMRLMASGALGLAGCGVAAALGASGQMWGVALGVVVAVISLASATWWYTRLREVRALIDLADWDTTTSVLNLRRKLADAESAEEQARKGEARSRERLGQAQGDFEVLMLRLGVSAEMIGKHAPDAVARLESVVAAQQASANLNRASSRVEEVRARLQDLLGAAAVIEGASPASAASGSSADGESPVSVLADVDEITRFIEGVLARVREYEKLAAAAKQANDNLLVALRGDKAARRLLGRHSLDELQAEQNSLSASIGELDERLTDLGRQIIEQSAERRSLERGGGEPLSSRENLELARGEISTRIEGRLVSGLAHRLATRLLTQAVKTHRKTRRPALLSRAEEMAKEAAADWTSITGNPHSPEKDGDLLVESARGEHPSKRLSLGAQSLLFLKLRLATIEEQSESRGVRLPLILDDVLVGIDDERLDGCLGVLSRFSSRHQVILLTCHERVVRRARSAGAVPVDWRG